MQMVLPDGTVYRAADRFQVKADPDTVKWGFQVRPAAVRLGGAPAVFRTGPILDYEAFDRARFTREWQLYAFELLSLAKFQKPSGFLGVTDRAYIVRAFNSVYDGGRAFTNKAGVEQFNNYITGETNRGQDPKIDPLICALNVVTGSAVQNTRGEWMVQLESFREDESPPPPSLLDPRICWAKTITSKGVINNFPQLGGVPVPYPYIAVAPYYYPLIELREL